MSTELAHVNDSQLTLLPPAQHPAQAAIEMLRGHAEMMQMAWELATKMVQTQLVPTRLRGKPQDATAAILYGAEIGLSPIQSLQRVIPIHGQPTLEALTMVGLLEAKGYTIRTVEETDEAAEVHGWKPCRDPERDKPDASFRRTIAWATRAGYVPKPSSEKSPKRPDVDDDWVTVTKTFEGRAKKSVVGNMKYITDPQAMLVAKCRTLVCKELAPHILLGIGGSTEEMRSEPRYSDDDSASSEPGHVEPITVDEIVGDVQGQSRRKLSKVVRPASSPVVDAVAENDTVGAPGAPTAKTPGQTGRVTESLNKARATTGESKQQDLNDEIAEIFKAADCHDLDDQQTVIANITLTKPSPGQNPLPLSDTELHDVKKTLDRWWNAGELTDRIRDILNNATLAAESEE